MSLTITAPALTSATVYTPPATDYYTSNPPPLLQIGSDLSIPGYELAFNDISSSAVLSAVVMVGNAHQLDATAAAASMEAASTGGEAISFQAEAAAVQLIASVTGLAYAAQASPAQLEATLVSAGNMSFAATAAAATLEAQLQPQTLLQFSTTSRPATLQAQLTGSVVAALEATARPATLQATALTGTVLSCTITAPPPITSAVLAGAVNLAAELVAAMPGLSALLAGSVSGSNCEIWLVATKTLGHRTYSPLPFNSFCQPSGRPLLATGPDGVYLLEGDLDGDLDVLGRIEYGSTDFGQASVKHIPSLRVSCEGAGLFTVATVSDGGQIRTYDCEIDQPGLWQNKRKRLSRGLRSRYWGVRLEIPRGVAVETIELQPELTGRSR